MMTATARTNQQLYRLKQLHRLAESQSDATTLQDILLDALAVEAMKAFQYLIAELADIYKVSGNQLENLRQYNPDMAELREIEAQLADQNSWLSLLHRHYQQALGQQALGQGVQASATENLLATGPQADTNFYSTCLHNLQVWVQQFRQQGQFW